MDRGNLRFWVWSPAIAGLLLLAAQATPLAAGGAATQRRVLRIRSDAKNNVHVTLDAKSGGQPREVIIPAEPGQTGIEDAKISDDGSIGGWLVLYRNPDGGQAIPSTLVLFRDGKVLRRVASGQAFWSWGFEPHGGSFAYPARCTAKRHRTASYMILRRDAFWSRGMEISAMPGGRRGHACWSIKGAWQKPGGELT